MRGTPHTRALWSAWAVSRIALVVLLCTVEHPVLGDIRYYVASLDALPGAGIDHTLAEYPLPGLAIIAVPWLLAGLVGMIHEVDVIAGILALLACVADGAFLWLVDRRPTPSDDAPRRAPGWLWVAGPLLLGATSYARFDMVPAVLVGTALLLMIRRPLLAGAAAAVATGVKLWPVLLVPALAARRSVRARSLVGVVGTGAILVAASLAVGGWDRLVSPVTYQSARGLQVESIAATPLVLARALDHNAYLVFFSPYRAMEIDGYGGGVMLALAKVALVLLAVALLVLWWRAWRTAELSRDAVCWLCLAAVTGFVVVSKVFSAQYVLWLLPLASAALAVSSTSRGRRRLAQWSCALLVVASLTQAEYPLAYGGIVRWEPIVSLLFSGLLVVRNALVVALLLVALREAWWHTSRASTLSAAGRSPASRPDRAGTPVSGCGGTTTSGAEASPGSAGTCASPTAQPPRLPPPPASPKA